MIEKQCQFSGRSEAGLYFHLLHPGYEDSIELVKEAQVSAPLLDEVRAYLKDLKRADGKLYVLLSALGAGEYWGANTNGDFFPEQSLLHTPQGWNDLGRNMQRLAGAQWEWGYPTFYNAHAYQHHINKNPARAFGDVEYACWDSGMKRVLLVVAIDRARAKDMGAIAIVDKIDNGEFADVSMGCRVPFDTCSICTDWTRITGNPRKDLAEHRRSAIRGLSVTTKDYCQHLRFEVGQIYPDGRKVWMWNLHPKFFDISFVFIGADKGSKVMAKLAHCPIREDKTKCASCIGDRCSIPSAHVHEVWSRASTRPMDRDKTAQYQAFPEFEDPQDEVRINRIVKEQQRRLGRRKTAEIEKTSAMLFEPNFQVAGWSTLEEAFAVSDDMTKLADLSLKKKAEIIKRIQSHFNAAMPGVGDDEPDIPDAVLDDMSSCPADALGTAGGLGIVLKPREFQRVFIRAVGEPGLADDLDNMGVVFDPRHATGRDFSISSVIVPRILEALRPLIEGRSALMPALGRRSFQVRVVVSGPSMDHPLLDKVASAYASYRQGLVYGVADLVPRLTHEHPEVLGDLYKGDLFPEPGPGLVKAGGDVVQSLLGMFPATYINRAYLPGPVSQYVEDHASLMGLRAAAALAASGEVA